MPKPICNEKGGIFVELAIVFTLMFTFYAGTLSVHRAAARKFSVIVRSRNEAIEKIRRQGAP